MQESTCVCRSCVDPREHGFFTQHGLPNYNGLFMARSKGAFVSKPSPTHDVSSTGLMLIQMNKKPVFILQGHRDCAAVKILFNTQNKDPVKFNNTEREFLRSHSDAVEAVKEYATVLKPEEQLVILEKICVLQSINNLFSFEDLNLEHNYNPIMYAYYSMTLPIADKQPSDATQLGLMIFDPEQQVFANTPAPEINNGIRIADLINIQTLLPHDHGPFKITHPIDLIKAVRNEVNFTLANVTPHINKPSMQANGK